MAEQKAAQPKKDPEPAPAPLGDAGASGNPLVHDLLAHRDIAVLNGDAGAVAAVNAKLAELGVE